MTLKSKPADRDISSEMNEFREQRGKAQQKGNEAHHIQPDDARRQYSTLTVSTCPWAEIGELTGMT
jgi:hypothetical protein